MLLGNVYLQRKVMTNSNKMLAVLVGGLKNNHDFSHYKGRYIKFKIKL